jgi:transposase
LTPKSTTGETDYSGRISKNGPHHPDQANQGLCSAQELGDADRKASSGMNKAKVALARKLAEIMLRMLKDNVPINSTAKATAMAS